MKVDIVPTRDNELENFIVNLQASFHRGAVKENFCDEDEIISREDILESFNADGAQIFNIVRAGKIVGGAVVAIHPNNHNELVLFFVNADKLGQDIGFAAWQEIEKLFPATEIWETATPHFAKRNLHFYINKCGFHAVEFFNPHHPNKDYGGDYFFRFEKVMSQNPLNAQKN